MITLFDDQRETIERLRDALKKNKAVLMQSPTGSGKTAMATHMIATAQSKERRTIFTVPRKELLKQTTQAFDDSGIPHGYIAAGYPFNPYSRIHIGMVDTMARRIDKLPDCDLLIVDETHFGATSLDAVVSHYKNKGAYIIGLSATPWKLSGEGLGKWYDDMVCGPDIDWLIKNKRLSDYRLFAPSSPDLSSVPMSGGDYAKGALAAFMEGQRKLIGDAVKHYRERAMGRLNIAYCTSIKHSEMTAAAFQNAGIPAAHIDGNTSDDDKRKIIRAYARREILVLCNCELLTFGFDLKMASGMDVTIESMSDLRPTKSLALQMQKWGRVLRYKDYHALIFDHAGNAAAHGLPCSEREWSLSDRCQGKRNAERAPATRQCPNCFFVHSPLPVCPECGHKYELKGREIDEEDGELVEVDKEAEIQSRKIEQSKAHTIEELTELGRRRGYKNPSYWAAQILSARMAKGMRR